MFYNKSNWYDYVSDVETPDSTLRYSLTKYEQTDDLTFYFKDSGFVFIPKPNWFGVTTFDFSATDEGGSSLLEPFKVYVLPVNDPPVLADIPDISLFEDDSTFLSINDYLFDAESVDKDVTVVAGLVDSSVTDLKVSIEKQTHIAKIEALNNTSGDFLIAFIAKDDSSAIGTDTISVTILPVNDAPVFVTALNEIKFNEDDSLKFSYMDWYKHVNDIDNPVNALVFKVDPTKRIMVIKQDSTFVFKSTLNWFGKDTLNIYVSDSLLSDTTSLVVNVNSINDFPYFSNLPDSMYITQDSLYLFNIWNYSFDVETSSQNLQYAFSSNQDSISINYIRFYWNLCE